MILERLDGVWLSALAKRGALSLASHMDEVDRLNVFPVPDGDTGTNMSRTVEGGIEAIGGDEEKDISLSCRKFARAMLMAARGNSGVILSQIFRGISKALAGKADVDAEELSEAFLAGVKQAYGAVDDPVEGTILTVVREASEYASKNLPKKATINDYFALHLKQARKSLAETIDLLPVLKEAGVIDAGGAGYVYLLIGFVECLEGRKDSELEEISLSSPKEGKTIKQASERKKFAVVAVADGEGIAGQFRSFGADVVIDGGRTMNPSTEDFLGAFRSVDAENIFVFPNDPNDIMAAEQAAGCHGKANVVVIRSTSIPQCFGALSMLDFGSGDLTLITGAFREAVSNVSTIKVARAVRKSSLGGLDVVPGDWIGILDGNVVSKAENCVDAGLEAIAKIPLIEDKEVATFIFGKDALKEDEEKLLSLMKRRFPGLETGSIEGGQEVYDVLIGIE